MVKCCIHIAEIVGPIPTPPIDILVNKGVYLNCKFFLRVFNSAIFTLSEIEVYA